MIKLDEGDWKKLVTLLIGFEAKLGRIEALLEKERK